jgi:ornithine cyclodeaminase/alanine dehydrogenase-like protein (mu-crystallin family)
VAFLVLRGPEIERLLPMGECIEVVAAAVAALETGDVSQAPRMAFAPRNATGTMAWMPAHRASSEPVFGMKVLRIVPDNPGRGLDRHQGEVLLADGKTGELRALLDAPAITNIRTAAASAVATRLLAREDARVLTIIGTGAQASRHLQAIPLIRPIDRVLVVGRTRAQADRFVDEASPDTPVRIEAAANAEAAVRDADIVVCATTSEEPVLYRRWLAPGTHVNIVGVGQLSHREIDLATVADSLLFTDLQESLELEAGEYKEALAKGLITPTHLRGNLGELVLGKVQGRTDGEQLTLFRSHGMAVLDLAAAEYIVSQAHAHDVGRWVET